MNKGQVILELNQFTKEEIIEAIADTDSILANRITSKLFQVKRKNLDVLVDAAFKKWDKASDELIAYLKQFNNKGVSLLELSAEEQAKLIKLREAEEQADKELQALYKKQDKVYSKIR